MPLMTAQTEVVRCAEELFTALDGMDLKTRVETMNRIREKLHEHE
jgi:hypothetical protein